MRESFLSLSKRLAVSRSIRWASSRDTVGPNAECVIWMDAREVSEKPI